MKPDRPAVAVTGAAGFIGQNLVVRLRERDYAVHPVTRDTPDAEARSALGESDVVFHLAGANRPQNLAEFMTSNRDYSRWVASAITEGGKRPLVIASSSAKVGQPGDYGESKRAGENALLEIADSATVAIYRLPNLFGKWARPNYNSAVATFCHNLARGLPIRIDDADAPLQLAYIDDLIDEWLELVAERPAASGVLTPRTTYSSTVGEVARILRTFAETRSHGDIGNVGEGLERALYATFVSHLPESAFSYPLEPHRDIRGSFTEMLRTPSSGQVSFFTARPGVTRGGHYHHSKVEKFLVVQGQARFRFRHIMTDESHELLASAENPTVVETIPGWTHDVTNVGAGTMVAIVWANERFDPDHPDTVTSPL